MAIDAPPPVIVTQVAPEALVAPAPVYGPIDPLTEETDETEGDCSESSEGEIVVCREIEGDEPPARLDLPPRPTAMENIARAIRKIRIGPFEVVAGGPNGSVGFGLRLRF